MMAGVEFGVKLNPPCAGADAHGVIDLVAVGGEPHCVRGQFEHGLRVRDMSGERVGQVLEDGILCRFREQVDLVVPISIPCGWKPTVPPVARASGVLAGRCRTKSPSMRSAYPALELRLRDVESVTAGMRTGDHDACALGRAGKREHLARGSNGDGDFDRAERCASQS